MDAPVPLDEFSRRQALKNLHILDTAPERAFDDLVFLASYICQTPIALLSLVDTDRQWFKARVGLDVAETPRDVAFCAHTIFQRELLIVPDALLDDRFADNPLVRGKPYIRFYAGVPLFTTDRFALGTLCAIDRVPRTLDALQIRALRALAREAEIHLNLRQQLLAAAPALSRTG